MKTIYYLRCFFIGYEFMLMAIGLASYLFFGDFLAQLYSKIHLNKDAVDWIMLFPIAVAGWTLNEGRGVVFPDENTNKVLHAWPEYWKLKAHFNIGVLNCFFYSLPCIAIWLFGALNTFSGAWAFLVFVGALSLNALSFYTATIAVKSALIRLNDKR